MTVTVKKKLTEKQEIKQLLEIDEKAKKKFKKREITIITEKWKNVEERFEDCN